MDVFVVWGNTDLTEGRGREYPLRVCEKESTAKRLGVGRYVMGTDCRHTKEKAYYINGHWYMPGILQSSSKEDDAEEEKMMVRRIAAEKKTVALKKAKELGLSDEDIENLK